MATLPLDPAVSADARAIRLRGWTLALLTLVYFFSFMDRYILSILLEAIKADLQLNDTQLGLLSGFAFALFYATLGIPVAWLADRASRRDIIAVALALWFGVAGSNLAIVAACSAVPTSSSAYVLARQMGGDAPILAQIIALQTIAAAITMPIAIGLAS